MFRACFHSQINEIQDSQAQGFMRVLVRKPKGADNILLCLRKYKRNIYQRTSHDFHVRHLSFKTLFLVILTKINKFLFCFHMDKFDMYNFRVDEREIQFMNLKHEN